MQTSIIDGLPVYEALISDEDCGMVRISLVDSPAVLTNWQAFRDQTDTAPQRFSVADEEQRLVRGVVIRADFPIIRVSPTGKKYYIIFRADTIRRMAEKYLAENRQNRVNTMHSGEEVRGVQMVQYFIKDTARGISPEGYEDVADGSLFAEFHVTNEDVWAAIKAGIFMGFSLEGFFDFQPETDQRDIDTIVDELAGRFSSQIKSNRDTAIMKIAQTLERLRELLEADHARVTCGRVTTDRGVIAWPGTEDLKAGDPVSIIDQDGGERPAEDGEYMTEDGKTIVVAGGLVAEIRDPEAEVAPETEAAEEDREQKMGAVETDKGAIEWDGEEDLREGLEVFVRDGDGNRIPAPEGEYTIEDGKVIVVVEGKVAEIRDPRAEVAPEAPEIEDLRTQLRDAMAANTTLEVELEAAREEIARLKAQPSAKPAHEEMKEASRAAKTGNKSIDRLAEILGA